MTDTNEPQEDPNEDEMEDLRQMAEGLITDIGSGLTSEDAKGFKGRIRGARTIGALRQIIKELEEKRDEPRLG